MPYYLAAYSYLSPPAYYPISPCSLSYYSNLPSALSKPVYSPCSLPCISPMPPPSSPAPQNASYYSNILPLSTAYRPAQLPVLLPSYLPSPTRKICPSLVYYCHPQLFAKLTLLYTPPPYTRIVFACYSRSCLTALECSLVLCHLIYSSLLTRLALCPCLD